MQFHESNGGGGRGGNSGQGSGSGQGGGEGWGGGGSSGGGWNGGGWHHGGGGGWHHGGGGGWGGGGSEVLLNLNFGGGYESPIYEPTSMYNEAYGNCFGANNYGGSNYYNNYCNQWNQAPVYQSQDYLQMTPPPYPIYEQPPVMLSQAIMAEPMWPIYHRGGLGIGFGGRSWHVGLFI